MKKLMICLTAVAISATGCSSETGSSGTVSTASAVEVAPAGVYCTGTDVEIGGTYYVQFRGQDPENLGVCTALEQITADEWSTLNLNRQCALTSDKLISQHHGVVTYYGDLADPQSLDSALAVCVKAGGEPAPTRR